MSVCIIISCDAKDALGPCGELFHMTGGTVEQARQAARAAGWTRTGTTDRCPLHSTATIAGRPATGAHG